MAELKRLAEVIQRSKFRDELKQGVCRFVKPKREGVLTSNATMLKQAVTSGFVTFASHVESRISFMEGYGYYTIGPCGEELLSGVGLALRPTDMTALHYRHLATQVARQLAVGNESLESIILNRARGHVCSSLDPVTGGNHCSLGVSEYDFLVTSTLASQCCPAVGRALGHRLKQHMNVPSSHDKLVLEKDAISYVSVGDGSVNNSHFLSARNLSEYASYRNFECPVLFGISDNDICISLPGHKFLRKRFLSGFQMPVYEADGSDFSDVYQSTLDAAAYVREKNRPATIVYSNLPRRFGHAATDRQNAYYNSKMIADQAENNPLGTLCAQLVECGVVTFQELSEEFDYIINETEKAFKTSKAEKRPTTNAVQVPLVPYSAPHTGDTCLEFTAPSEELLVMRKAMTKFYDELLTTQPDCVYLGEDVTHGGYYLVTDGLVKKHGRKIADFPPDETSLLGVGIGYSQVGLTPVVEIPYAKYLDCGFDMFQEAVVMTWLSNGTKNNGMVIRLQGFDRGSFGGNFHTHNTLYLPPGLDVLCFSNGDDYVRGMRYAFEQARAGRVVMVVDSTALLGMLGAKAYAYPALTADNHIDFDHVGLYEGTKNQAAKRVAVVSYGNGVHQALQAQSQLENDNSVALDVLDTPCVSQLSPQLLQLLSSNGYDEVVFFDPCKAGQNPYASMACDLVNQGVLLGTIGEAQGLPWRMITAPKTYNPLGQLSTFIDAHHILDAVGAST